MIVSKDVCVNFPTTDWRVGEKLGVEAVCGKNELDRMEKPITTYKSLQQLYCEDMAGRRKRKCFLSSPSHDKLPFNPLCLLQVREGLCQKGLQQKQMETLLKLQEEELRRKYVEEKIPEKEKAAMLQKLFNLHALNRQRQNKKPWTDIYKEPKKCAPKKTDAFKPYELLQQAYKGKPTPSPPVKPTPSSLTKSIIYNTRHEARDHLDFRLRALYNADMHFNASEAVVCGQHLTALLHRPCAKANKCGCCSCDCNVRVGAGHKASPTCVCPREACYPQKASACLCSRNVLLCSRREDGTWVRINEPSKREHASSVKKAIEGPHVRMANDGYARIKESGIRFNS